MKYEDNKMKWELALIIFFMITVPLAVFGIRRCEDAQFQEQWGNKVSEQLIEERYVEPGMQMIPFYDASTNTTNYMYMPTGGYSVGKYKVTYEKGERIEEHKIK